MRKPAHLGPEYGAQFQDPAVVSAYRHRPPYPPDVFELLTELTAKEARAVLDLGAGRGEIARTMAVRAERVDAVEPSAAMIEAGKRLPSGDAPNLHWIHAPAEDASLQPPYGLVTAGMSLHWIDWDVIFPVLATALHPEGALAVVDVSIASPPWGEELRSLIAAHSTNRDFRPYDLIEELVERGLFAPAGDRMFRGAVFQQSVDDYVDSIHSQNGFSRNRMTAASAGTFDGAVRELVAPFADRDSLLLQVRARVSWGRPTAPSSG